MNTRTLRRFTFGWGAVIALAGWMAYSQLFSSVTTTLTCDRAADLCKLSGGTQRPVPRPSQIEHAQIRHHLEHKQGIVYDIYLDELAISPYAARSDESVASYRAAVAKIEAFLHDPTQPHLDASFTHWASTRDKLGAIGVFAGTLVVLGFMIVVLRRQRE
jgi:hypothetical protein